MGGRRKPLLTQEVVAGEGEFTDRNSRNQVLLDDSFEHVRSTGVIPNPFRIDDGDGTLFAYLKAVRFRSEDPGLGADKVQFLQPLLEEAPGLHGRLFVTTLGFGLITTKEDMTFNPRYSQRLGLLLKGHQFLIGS